MRPGWDVDPAVLRRAARTLEATAAAVGGTGFHLARTTDEILTDWQGALPALSPTLTGRLASRDAWQGQGAQAFAGRAARDRERLADLEDLHRQAAQVLDRYATELAEARGIQATADRQLATAEQDASGSTRAAGLRGADQAALAAVAQRAARTAGEAAELAIGAHVRAAADLWRLARQALRLTVGDDVDAARATATGWLSVLAIPGAHPPTIPTGQDPQHIARWWQTLTPEQRTALLATSPKRLGSLAGVPPPWRDWANRLALQQALLGPGAAPPSFAQLKTYATRSGAGRLWHTLTTTHSDPRLRLRPQDIYLLDFDLDSPGGQAVIALGDPATATHIGITVPGTNNDLTNVHNPLRDAARLRTTVPLVAEPAALQTTSTIMWLGYETPTSIAGADPRGYGGVVDAADPGEAEAGAPLLKEFVSELRAAHNPASRPHISVFGHSYGSTVTGMAAAHGMNADDVVLFGSPGAGTGTAAELDMPGHVWATRIHDDPIRFGEGAAALGEDPVDHDFGAKRFAVNPPPIQSGHSEYYKLRTKGVRNFARILIGSYETMER